MSTVKFASLLESALGCKIAKAVKILLHSTSSIRNSSDGYRIIPDDLRVVVNRSGSMLLELLQGLLSSKSLENLGRKERLALFLTLVATIAALRYHQVQPVSQRPSIALSLLNSPEQETLLKSKVQQVHSAELIRIMNHYMVLVGQAAKVFGKQWDTKLLVGTSTALWRKKGNWIWLPLEHLDNDPDCLSAPSPHSSWNNFGMLVESTMAQYDRTSCHSPAALSFNSLVRGREPQQSPTVSNPTPAPLCDVEGSVQDEGDHINARRSLPEPFLPDGVNHAHSEEFRLRTLNHHITELQRRSRKRVVIDGVDCHDLTCPCDETCVCVRGGNRYSRNNVASGRLTVTEPMVDYSHGRAQREELSSLSPPLDKFLI